MKIKIKSMGRLDKNSKHNPLELKSPDLNFYMGFLVVDAIGVWLIIFHIKIFY